MVSYIVNISGLGSTGVVNQQDIIELLNEIEFVRMEMDPEESAFVEFMDSEQGDEAIKKLNGHVIKELTLKASWSNESMPAEQLSRDNDGRDAVRHDNEKDEHMNDVSEPEKRNHSDDTLHGDSSSYKNKCDNQSSEWSTDRSGNSRTHDRELSRDRGDGQRCYNCEGLGHLSRDCPKPRKAGGGTDQACYNCQKTGHISRDCPEPRQSGGRPDDRACYNCHQHGHISRDCPQGGGGRGGDRACYTCNRTGHISRDCPDGRGGGGGGGGGDTRCYNCSRTGHISRECPEAPRPRGACYSCGKEGHISRDCPGGTGGRGGFGGRGRSRSRSPVRRRDDDRRGGGGARYDSRGGGGDRYDNRGGSDRYDSRGGIGGGDKRDYGGRGRDDRGYGGERRDDRGYGGDRRDDRGYGGDRRDDRGYGAERRDGGRRYESELDRNTINDSRYGTNGSGRDKDRDYRGGGGGGGYVPISYAPAPVLDPIPSRSGGGGDSHWEGESISGRTQSRYDHHSSTLVRGVASVGGDRDRNLRDYSAERDMGRARRSSGGLGVATAGAGSVRRGDYDDRSREPTRDDDRYNSRSDYNGGSTKSTSRGNVNIASFRPDDARSSHAYGSNDARGSAAYSSRGDGGRAASYGASGRMADSHSLTSGYGDRGADARGLSYGSSGRSKSPILANPIPSRREDYSYSRPSGSSRDESRYSSRESGSGIGPPGRDSYSIRGDIRNDYVRTSAAVGTYGGGGRGSIEYGRGSTSGRTDDRYSGGVEYARGPSGKISEYASRGSNNSSDRRENSTSFVHPSRQVMR
eukprot:CFRG4013T1